MGQKQKPTDWAIVQNKPQAATQNRENNENQKDWLNWKLQLVARGSNGLQISKINNYIGT